MKRELKALLFLLLPTRCSTEAFVNLALADDQEHQRKIDASFNKTLNLDSKEKRVRHLRQSLTDRRKELYTNCCSVVIGIVVIVWVAQVVGVEITNQWLSQFFAVVLLVWTQAFELKNSEMLFDRDDIVERTLSLAKRIFFWVGVILTVIFLLMP